VELLVLHIIGHYPSERGIMEVIHIPSFHKVEGSDRLFKTTIDNLPCIVGSNLINEEWFIYVPIDTVLSEPLFKLININNKEYTPKRARVKAVRLRGHFSEGLLLPLSEVETIYPEVKHSDNILNITGSFVYRDVEDIEDLDKITNTAKSKPTWLQRLINKLKPKHALAEYTDTSRIEKAHLASGAYLPTVKVHGTSVRYTLTPRFLWFKQQLIVASRRKVNPQNKIYSQVAVNEKIKEALLQLQKSGLKRPTIVGEIAGLNVQKGFPYEGNTKLYVYGIHANDEWLGAVDIHDRCIELGLTPVPVLEELFILGANVDKGEVCKRLEELCDRNKYPSIDSSCVCREGIVLQRICSEKANTIHHRTVYKYIGQEYRSK
jgi:hypothetical protein